MKQKLIEDAYYSIVEADEELAVKVLDETVAEGVPVWEILEKGFFKGMEEVGDEFEAGEVFLPELVFAAEVMETVIDKIDKEFLEKKDELSKLKMVIATIEGDVHDIGKAICMSFLRFQGVQVYDLGRSVSVDEIIDRAEKIRADIIGISSMMTTTMKGQEALEKRLRQKNIRNKYITMVGGAPVTQAWAEKISADIYTENAYECSQKAVSCKKDKI